VRLATLVDLDANGVETGCDPGRLRESDVGLPGQSLRRAAVSPAMPARRSRSVVASLDGGPKSPVWYYNLKKNPHVELQDGATKSDYTAREVTGDDEQIVWPSDLAEVCGAPTIGDIRRLPPSQPNVAR
jgi:deazaflavin-dependent oxidoreductase (nitroreductase family)